MVEQSKANFVVARGADDEELHLSNQFRPIHFGVDENSNGPGLPYIRQQ